MYYSHNSIAVICQKLVTLVDVYRSYNKPTLSRF